MIIRKTVSTAIVVASAMRVNQQQQVLFG